MYRSYWVGRCLLWGLGALLLVALLTGGLTTLAAAHGGNSNLVHACVKTKDDDEDNDREVEKMREVRLVSAGQSCKKGWEPLDWNIQGAPGPQGPPGLPGSPGANTTAANTLYIGSDQDGNEPNSTLAFGTDGSPKVTLLENGYLGVGTTTPGALLHVAGGGNQVSYLRITDTLPGGGDFGIGAAVGGLNVFGVWDFNAAAVRLAIKGDGNVGIGTASPQSRLQVAGGYIQFPTIAGAAPPASECDQASEAGRVVVRTDGAINLYICTGTGGWVGK